MEWTPHQIQIISLVIILREECGYSSDEITVTEVWSKAANPDLSFDEIYEAIATCPALSVTSDDVIECPDRATLAREYGIGV